jgi:hypothetical protein
MSVLLDEVKEVSKAKPMMWVNLGGIWKKKRLCIVLSIVSGDQKSQDFLCGRKAINNGSAGRVHRGCMTSAVNSTAVGPDGALHGGCQKPLIQVLNRLNDLALMDVNDNANSGPMALVQQLLPSGSDLFSLFLIFHLVEYSKAVGGIRGTVSIDAFIRIALAATTKDNSTALNRLGRFWISSTVSIHIIRNIEISISSHIAVAIL